MEYIAPAELVVNTHGSGITVVKYIKAFTKKDYSDFSPQLN